IPIQSPRADCSACRGTCGTAMVNSSRPAVRNFVVSPKVEITRRLPARNRRSIRIPQRQFKPTAMTWPEEIARYLLSTVGALLPIVNPLSAVGMVVSITANLPEHERVAQVKRACIYMFFILATFLVAGGLIMSFFGISIPGLRITGGLIISYLGFQMLFPDHGVISSQEHDEAVQKRDVSFTPLAMPGLAGPGSIA